LNIKKNFGRRFDLRKIFGGATVPVAPGRKILQCTL
jgi:hypothetical protein